MHDAASHARSAGWLVGELVVSYSFNFFLKKMVRSAPVVTYTYDVRILQRHLVLVQVREGGYDLRTRTEHSGQRAREGAHTCVCVRTTLPRWLR
jgi:hypothetical protein